MNYDVKNENRNAFRDSCEIKILTYKKLTKPLGIPYK